MNANLKSFLLGSAGTVLLITILQNMQTVTVRFLFWEFSVSRLILIPFIFVTGFVAGAIFARRKSQRGG